MSGKNIAWNRSVAKSSRLSFILQYSESLVEYWTEHYCFDACAEESDNQVRDLKRLVIIGHDNSIEEEVSSRFLKVLTNQADDLQLGFVEMEKNLVQDLYWKIHVRSDLALSLGL